MESKNKKSKAYIVGGGIASLSCAVLLIQEGKIRGENIIIFEASDSLGGSLDAKSTEHKEGYIMRGYRMFEEKVYGCTFDLMSRIPSINDSNKTEKEIFDTFNKNIKTCAKARLIENGKVVDAKDMNLTLRSKISLLLLMLRNESSLKNKRINDYFKPEFFKSNFWIEFCTTFAFQPWHSLKECRRYILRFIQDLPYISTLKCVESTQYNQYDSIVAPLLEWLKQKNVKLQINCKVTDIKFKEQKNKIRASSIFVKTTDEEKIIEIKDGDNIFVTLGSMASNSKIGSMTSAPVPIKNEEGTAWDLWEKIAKNQTSFGNPSTFKNHINESKWESFTITLHDEKSAKILSKIIGNDNHTDGGVTLKDSPWFISFVVPHQPHFRNQPKHTTVLWGYGLSPEKNGKYVTKKMSECNGTEILTELFSNLGLAKDLPHIIKNTTCIPCMLPYTTSQFLPRSKGDRPLVIPKGAKNFAFLGQFCEIPNDTVFTVEYSIRSAQIAVYSLLKLNKKPSKLYKGQHNIKVIFNALKVIFS